MEKIYNEWTKNYPEHCFVSHKGFSGWIDNDTLPNKKRCTNGTYPANTLEAVKHSIRLGYKMFEIDITTMGDGVWVVSHEINTLYLDKPENRRKLSDLKYSDIKDIPISYNYRGEGFKFWDFSEHINKEYVPTLESVLSFLSDKDVFVILDTKWVDHAPYTNENFDELARIIKDTGMQEKVAAFGASAKELPKRIESVVTAYFDLPSEDENEAIEIMRQNKNFMFSAATKRLDRVLPFAKKYNVPLAVWISDNYDEADALFEKGVNYILTDFCLDKPNLSDYKKIASYSTEDFLECFETFGDGMFYPFEKNEGIKLFSELEYSICHKLSFQKEGLLPGDLIEFSASASVDGDEAMLRIETANAPISRSAQRKVQNGKLVYTVNDAYPYDLNLSLKVKNAAAYFSDIEINIYRENKRGEK